MLKQLKPAFLLFLLMLTITGLFYPLLITGAGQVLFPHQASGSLVIIDGRPVGSSLIGQNFSRPEYFHPRPSLAGNGYDAMSSGASNLSSTNVTLQATIENRSKKLQQQNPGQKLPSDLLTASSSGLDPDISPQAAIFQVPAIAKARNVSQAELIKLVEQNTQQRFLGIFGEPKVNVLLLNIVIETSRTQ